jgi:hypothetical protein
VDSKLKLRCPSSGVASVLSISTTYQRMLGFHLLNATARILIKNKRLSLMTEIDLFER